MRVQQMIAANAGFCVRVRLRNQGLFCLFVLP